MQDASQPLFEVNFDQHAQRWLENDPLVARTRFPFIGSIGLEPLVEKGDGLYYNSAVGRVELQSR